MSHSIPVHAMASIRRVSRSEERGRFVLLASGLALLGLLAPALGRAQPVTHAEFTLSHSESVGQPAPVVSTDSEPGQDAGSSIEIFGGVVGAHGNHSVHVRASVEAQPNGAPRLKASGEHVFELSGSASDDVWLSATSTLVARATLIDDLTLSNLPVGAATVELYWDVHGFDDAEIDLDPPENLLYDFHTDLRLLSDGGSANTGANAFVQLVPWPGGLLEEDLDDRKFVEDYAMASFSLESEVFELHIETSYEVEPFTHLINEGSVQNFRADGRHLAAFYESAELVGVVVRDDDGDILPNVLIVAASGYQYPVLADVPEPPAPNKTISSPTAVLGTDLGEYSVDVVLEHMIDQSGLDKAFTSDETDFDEYFGLGLPPYGQGNYLNNWQSEVSFTLPVQGYVDFDLGETCLIDRLAIWNRSLENITVFVADAPSGPWQEVGAFVLADKLAYSYSYDPQILDLGGELEAHYLRIQIDSVHPLYPGDTYGYAIVGEVAVSKEFIPVPEPGLAGLVASGALGLGLLARRRTSPIR